MFGDVILDLYETVIPDRISAEAPVMVTRHQKLEARLGGAGNVAANIAAMGVMVRLHAVVDPMHINVLREQCKFANVKANFAGVSRVCTPIKKRIVDAQGAQLLRIDNEERNYVTVALKEGATKWFETQLYGRGKKVLCFSDYDKGSVPAPFFDAAKDYATFTVVNAKPSTVCCYPGADVMVLNLDEARELTHKTHVGDVCTVLKHRVGAARHWVITAGKHGMYWYWGNVTFTHIPAVPVDHIIDVTGAGDTVTATIAAHGCVNEEVLRKAAENAAKVIQKRGVAVP